MADVKLDLGAVIRDAESLVKVFEKLGSVAQKNMEMMASATGTLGKAVNNASFPAQNNSPLKMVSSKGQSVNDEFAEASLNGVIRNGYQQPQRVGFGAAGTIFKRPPEEQREADLAASIIRTPNADNVGAAQNAVAPTKKMAGWSLADVPGALSAQKEVTGANKSLEDTIKKMSADNATSNEKLSADILKTFKDRLNEKSEALDVAKGNFLVKPDDEESRNKLINATAELTEALHDATRAEKDSKKMGGGGEPPKDSLWDKLRESKLQWGAAAGAVLHAGFTGAGAYLSAKTTSLNSVIGRELQVQETAGALGKLGFNRTMASADMRTGENILKYHGDMFYKGAQGSEYLGADGFRRADLEAKHNQDMIETKDQSERSRARVGAAKDIGIGLATIGGSILGTLSTGGVGLGFGIAGAAYGVSQVLSGAGSLFNSEVNSTANEREGFGSVTAAAMRATGVSEKDMARIQQHRLLKDQLDTANFSESLRNAQVELHARDAFLIDKQLESKAATRQAVLSVGAKYALRGGELGNTLEHSINNSYRQIDNAEMARNRDLSRQVKRNIAPKDTATGDFMGNVSGYDDAALPTAGNFGFGPSLDGSNYAAKKGKPNRPLFPTSPWAKFGLSEAEFIGRGANVASVMGGSRGQIADATSRLSGLSMAGMGDFGQIIGNLGSLNQVSGGQNSEKKLEQIMSQAIAIGFDKSRTGQQFIGAVTQLSSSLGITETGSIGRGLALGASLLSGNEKADELSLSKAQRGMSEYAGYTSQSGGFVGAMKMRAAFGSGMGFGSGAGILSGKSSEQSMAMISELDSKGPITNTDLQDLLRINGGDKEKVKAALRGQISSAGTAVRGQFDVTNGRGSYAAALEAVGSTKLGSKERSEAMLEFRAKMNEASAASGVSVEAGSTMGLQDLVMKGYITQKEAKGELAKQKADGIKAGIDPATVNLQKYIDESSKRFNQTDNKVDSASYVDYLKKGGVAQIQGITAENVDKLTKEQKEQLDKDVKGLTMVDLAQGAENAYRQSAPTTRVEVTNWWGMSPVLQGSYLGNKEELTKNAPKAP